MTATLTLRLLSLFTLASALAVAGPLAAPPAAAAEAENLVKNADFTAGPAHASPAGWSHRTAGQGYVKTFPHGDPPHVEIGIASPGEDSFIQQIVQLPDDAVQLEVELTYQWEGVVGGEKGYQKGKVQARFTEGGDDFGKWFDFGNLTGSSDGWVTKARTIGVPDRADGLMIRTGFYGSQEGVLRVSSARVTPITTADVAAIRAQYRPAQAFGPAVTDARYGKLMRGININNWFCQPWNIRVNGQKGQFDARTFRAYVTRHDIDLIKSAGFDHIRLPVDPLFLLDPEDGSLMTELLPELDRAIAMIVDSGLAVIVDVHPKSNRFKKMKGKPIAERFVTWWGHFARHLHETTDPEWVFLETLNEPGGQGYWTQSFAPYQDRLLTIMRANAPHHTFIANGGAYMLAWELPKVDPHPDRNVIWAIHFYEPSPFTHQGAVWMKDWYRPLRNVPWPLTEDNIEEAIASVAEGDKATAKAKDVLRDQLKSGWATLSGMRERFDAVEAWSKEHDRRVHVGEWGVYEKYAPRESRLRYLETVADELASRGFGWALWDYCGGGFHVVTDPKAPSGRRELDAGVIEALGLQPNSVATRD